MEGALRVIIIYFSNSPYAGTAPNLTVCKIWFLIFSSSRNAVLSVSI